MLILSGHSARLQGYSYDALEEAAGRGFAVIVDLLLSHGADMRVSVSFEVLRQPA